MNPLRSVGAQLSLALAVLVAGSLGVVYLFVVPSLERNLVNAKLSQLEHVAPDLRQQLVNDQLGIHDPDFVGNASAAANARVVLFSTLASAPSPTLQAMADSRQGASSADVEDDPVALRAATTLQMQHGTLSRGDERFAEVALPVEDGEVLLFSASLHDSLGNVHLVQHRLLIAGVAALLASLLLGFGGASIFARRIRRLERAADRIAGGRFDEPVDDPTPDELGQLARAFDRMRLRLAHLDRARAEFIANASHELRTPLFSLGGFLELLTDEELDDETRAEFLATMREQVERLARLAGDLLDLSRLDAGRLRVEREPFELADVARGLVEEFQALASGRSTSSWTAPPARSATTSARFASAAPSSRTRCGIRRRGRGSSSALETAPGRRSRSKTTGRGSPHRSSGRSSTVSTAATARSPPAAASVSRSRGSWRSG